jgi:hypothetical protein
MSRIDQAARVTGPFAAADATARTGVQRIALSGASQSFVLPVVASEDGKKHNLSGRFIRMFADGDSIQWAFGVGSAPTIVRDQAAAVGTGHVSAGGTLVNGVPEHILVPDKATHVAFISKTASPPTSFLEFYVSDRPVL